MNRAEKQVNQVYLTCSFAKIFKKFAKHKKTNENTSRKT